MPSSCENFTASGICNTATQSACATNPRRTNFFRGCLVCQPISVAVGGPEKEQYKIYLALAYVLVHKYLERHGG